MSRLTREMGAAAAADSPPPALESGRRRVAIEGVWPAIDGGRFAAKRVVGEAMAVEADVFTDGHDAVSAVLLHRPLGQGPWQETPMQPLVNDRWRATFPVHQQGQYEFTVVAWVDHFKGWRRDLRKKADAGQDVRLDLLGGAKLFEEAAGRAEGREREELLEAAGAIGGDGPSGARVDLALDDRLAELMWLHSERRFATELGKRLRVQVDRPRARYSTWYELFPRSASADPSRHGTFRDVEARLGYVKEMGFDVLYLPPTHPIGRAYRKGPNNTLKAGEGDPGSPWAIGAEEGGHTEIHPELGTMEDFQRLVRAAEEQGIEIALDIAFQCSPEHPWVKQHPEWFKQRADGTIQYAENPPKKYQDIYPLDFESEDWQGLWEALRDVFLFWAERGVKIFRVDNPHTKALPFWEWAIAEVKERYPEAIFLSEAFTRPKMMYRLAKLGFTQSYTYFAWRNQPWEIEQYFKELTTPPVVDFFRPNAWPNTPDILTEYLQQGGRPASMARLVLAATLCASYGIYGPAFELVDVRAREPGSEEYLDSEKYQRRVWNLSAPHSLREFIARINRIRHENPALQQDRTLRFHGVNNERMICYSKTSDDKSNAIICVVNTDPFHEQWATVSLDMEALGLQQEGPFEVQDLLTGAWYTWNGPHNYVGLRPSVVPAHVLRIRRPERREAEFDPLA